MHLLPAHIKSKTNYLTSYLSICAVIILLLFSAVNLATYTAKPKVLGTATEINLSNENEIVFWEVFLKQNPTYLEGWLELYRLTGNENCLQKAKEINPNYF